MSKGQEESGAHEGACSINPEQRRSGGLTPTEGTGAQEALIEEENPPRPRSLRR